MLATKNKEVNLDSSTEIFLENICTVVSVNEFKLDSLLNLMMIEINPEYYIKNLLNSTLTLYDENRVKLLSLQPGEELVAPIESNNQYYFALTDQKTNNVFTTELIHLFSRNQFTCKINDLPSSSLNISSTKLEKKIYKNNGKCSTYNLDLTEYAKNPKNDDISSWIISVSADYIIVNKTQQVLNLEGLEIPIDEIRYSSSKSKEFRLKLARFETN